MSSYLTFYLVPKIKETDKTEKKEATPLSFLSFSRNHEVYRAYYESINPAYIGASDTPNYTELTEELAQQAINDIKEEVGQIKKRLKDRIAAYKELPALSQASVEEYLDYYTSTKEYIVELENTMNYLLFIFEIVQDVYNGCTDFEKVLINID